MALFLLKIIGKINGTKYYMQLNWTPGSFLDWIALITFIIVGGVAVFGIIDRERRKTAKDADAVDDRLITLLKGTVESLEKQVNTLKEQVADLGGKVENLQAENNMLRSILQGRDNSTKKLHEASLVAIERSKETLDIVKEISQSTQETNKNIENLYELMNRHLERVETIIQK